MSGDRAWTLPLGLGGRRRAATWALWKMGSRLPMPRSLEKVELETWLREAGGPAAAFAIVRAGALAVAAYATLLGVLGTLALASAAAALRGSCSASRCPRFARCSRRSGHHDHDRERHPGSGARTRRAEPTCPVMQMIGLAASEPPVMTLVIAPPAVAEKPGAAPATYTVDPGRHVLVDRRADAAHRRATTPTTGDRPVLAIAHRARTAIGSERRDEPDLIFPGQVFVLPPLS